MPNIQSSQRHTSSPSIDDVHEPMLDTESIESVRSNRRPDPPSAEAASIFFANNSSISVFGRVVGDELQNVILKIVFFTHTHNVIFNETKKNHNSICKHDIKLILSIRNL